MTQSLRSPTTHQGRETSPLEDLGSPRPGPNQEKLKWLTL